MAGSGEARVYKVRGRRAVTSVAARAFTPAEKAEWGRVRQLFSAVEGDAIAGQVELFFSLGRAMGVGGWPFIPPLDRPASYVERNKLLVMRKRIQDNARTLIANTRELNFALPLSPMPPFPASDPAGKDPVK